MPPPRGHLARSTGGCWTCRIRHRRCDESIPECRECTDRHITCHGYGPAPDWVDDPVKRRAELQRIKEGVKQNLRRTRKLGSRHSASRRGVAYNNVVDGHSTSAEQSEAREAELLMHYLDYIFPLQFPYYVDSPALGGRGWLLWLLSKRTPLRYAAFTLSALHQHTTSQNKTDEMESELIRYHTKAMQELRQVLSQCEMEGFDVHPEQRAGFLTCGTFLISFEVFQGGTSNWEPHLNALSLVAGQIDTDYLAAVACQSPRPASGVQRLIDAAILMNAYQLLWFDLISCVSTGKAPSLPYQTWLGLEGFDISCVMGCKNWAMLALGDVAHLEANMDTTNSGALKDSVADIIKRLQDDIRCLDNGEEQASSPTVCNSVTCVYATAILVQLSAMLENIDDRVESVYDAVQHVISALQKVPKGVSLRGLPWPICVAGVMATGDQRQFFKKLLQGILDKSGAGFTNCGTLFDILMDSWEHQDISAVQYTNAARSTMRRLGICALLS